MHELKWDEALAAKAERRLLPSSCGSAPRLHAVVVEGRVSRRLLSTRSVPKGKLAIHCLFTSPTVHIYPSSPHHRTTAPLLPSFSLPGSPDRFHSLSPAVR